ncbi:MAG: tyrosine-type recombinase/integrase [Bacteroidetes bacterium]|nr:tyrosine-type recombinase/integrase [Bacteroidota bacterium]
MTDSKVLVRASPFLDRLSSPDANLLPAFLHRFDREQTRRAYRNDISQFFGSEFVSTEMVRAVTFLHVNEHIAQLEDSGARASTIKRRVSAIRGFFDWLEALELVDRNPAHKQLIRRVRSASSRDQVVVFLTAEQAANLLAAADDGSKCATRNVALVETLLHCVLRRSEAAAMNYDHIRPLGRYWVLDLPATKGGANQYVKIPEHVVESIEAVRHFYGHQSGAIWRSLSRNNSAGRRLSAHSIYQIVKGLAERAAIPFAIGAHTLRHTGCTLAIESGASLQQVKEHARHKNVETTMVYIHQRDRLANSAADFISLPDAESRVSSRGDNESGRRSGARSRSTKQKS